MCSLPYGAARVDIMVGLLLMINYLCFFFFFVSSENQSAYFSSVCLLFAWVWHDCQTQELIKKIN
jgi:hypothetical protein